MAKNYQGVNGNWSGKVGNNVGAVSNGRTVIRIYQPIVSNPQTAAQMLQRSRLSIASSFLRSLAGIIKTGWKEVSKYGTAWAECIKQNMADAISLVGGVYTLDESKVVMSRGGVDLPYGMTATGDGNDITFQWTDNSDIGTAKADDELVYLLKNKTRGQWVASKSAAVRSSRTFTFSCPSAWTGEDIYVYAFFVRADDSDASNTQYLGTITL